MTPPGIWAGLCGWRNCLEKFPAGILALAGVLGMLCFRHKTRHWYFRYGLPAILLLQLGLAVWTLLPRGAT